ncbi:MAG: glycoside hydrolase family 3 C-terminal domain-containing protein [Porphyromonadaceae bacterium]|nr:glycoside hydrolase family 3 C-terminal domain-containing protein [Porphyromonadaceae bacterium]
MKKTIILLSFLCAGCFSQRTVAQDEPYKNRDLSPQERAADLTSRLTLEEKVSLMQNTSPAVPRLGIKPYNWWSEALHGVARAGEATVFPQTIGMAASFDSDLLYEVFTAVSDEARAKFHDAQRKGKYGRYQGLTFWTPNINIFRDPRWGRGQETYGEDPYLTSVLGLQVIRGLQGPADARYDKLYACAKHFAVHSGPEWSRHQFDAKDIDLRDLNETYLPAFKTAVLEGDVKEVMCAYNRFEGKPCCGSDRLLMQILREEWGYKHLVVSDCGAINDFYNPSKHHTHPDAAHASADAVLTGTDVECGDSYASLVDAVKDGLIQESDIDVSVRRLLTARFALGEMDDEEGVEWSKIPYSVVDCPEHRALALKIAQESIVLLQNRDNLLPLSTEKKIALVGPNANDSVMQWANYNGTPNRTVTLLDGIQEKLGRDVTYFKLCDWLSNSTYESTFNWLYTPDNQKGMVATYYNNTDLEGDVAATQIYTSPVNRDAGGNTVFEPGVNLTHFTARFESILRPEESGEMVLTVNADDGFRIFIDGEKLFETWKKNNNAKKELRFQVEKGKEYAIEIDYLQLADNAFLKIDLGQMREKPMDEEINALADADVVIFAGGISAQLEGESMSVNYPGFKGGDRTHIELPEIQRNILKRLHEMGKKVVLVNFSGSAMGLVPETETCDAIIQAWYPGQEGGTAVADVLFGDYNPSGKLPVTFYRNIDQLPDFQDYSMQGRTYRFMTEKPLYPFGFGLSYTTYEYGTPQVKKTAVKVGKEIQLTLSVTNTGQYDGEETVQLYVRKVDDTEGAPIRTLRAFKRIALKAGETQKVTFELTPEAFAFFDRTSGYVTTRPGDYKIWVGSSSAEENLQSLIVKLK